MNFLLPWQRPVYSECRVLPAECFCCIDVLCYTKKASVSFVRDKGSNLCGTTLIAVKNGHLKPHQLMCDKITDVSRPSLLMYQESLNDRQSQITASKPELRSTGSSKVIFAPR